MVQLFSDGRKDLNLIIGIQSFGLVKLIYQWDVFGSWYTFFLYTLYREGASVIEVELFQIFRNGFGTER